MNDLTSLTKIYPFKYGQFLGLIHDPWTAGRIRDTGEYSAPEVEVFRHYVRKEDTVLDVGALFGAHTIPLAQMAKTVYAFEPQNIPFKILVENVKLNGLDNVFPMQLALGAVTGGTRISEELSPAYENYWGLAKVGHNERGALVEQHDLDSIDLGKVDFIKIDVEGSETEVLVGAVETITTYRPVIYLEFNQRQNEILALLASYGYRNFYAHDLSSQPGTYMLLALPDHRSGDPMPDDMGRVACTIKHLDSYDYDE